MDPIEPWIDGNDVRRLAAQLLSSPSGSEIADSPDAGFGPGFEGFTSGMAEPVGKPAAPVSDPHPVQTPVSEPPLERQVSESLPVSTPPSEPQAVPQAEPQVPEVEPEAQPLMAAREVDSSNQAFKQVARPVANADSERSRGPLMERMLRFRDWLTLHAGARSVFVLDRDGQPVLDDPAYGKLHFLARSLSQAYRPVPGQPGNVHVKVGSDAYLVVIPVDTAFGCLVLGTVLPRPLDAPSVEIVAKGLADAAKPQGV